MTVRPLTHTQGTENTLFSSLSHSLCDLGQIHFGFLNLGVLLWKKGSMYKKEDGKEARVPTLRASWGHFLLLLRGQPSSLGVWSNCLRAQGFRFLTCKIQIILSILQVAEGTRDGTWRAPSMRSNYEYF